jgi:hypothetical protein
VKNGLLLLAVLSATASSGCGTVCNLAGGDPQPYGGLANDDEFFSACKPGCGGRNALFALGYLGFVLGEVGATAVGDTLTLPLTQALESKNHPDRWPDPATFIDGPVQYSTNIPEDAPGPK